MITEERQPISKQAVTSSQSPAQCHVAQVVINQANVDRYVARVRLMFTGVQRMLV